MAERVEAVADMQEYLAVAAERGRAMLLPALLEAQKRYHHVPKDVAAQIGRALKVPLADVYGVIEFYSMLSTEPTGSKVIRICESPACAIAGAAQVREALCDHLDVVCNQPTEDGQYSVESVHCLGLCDRAPAILVGERPVGQATADVINELVWRPPDPPSGLIRTGTRVLTARLGKIGPTNLDEYREYEGLRGLERALEHSPAEVIETVKASGLMGRGGAAFPTGIKWEGAAKAEGDVKYIICNGDESEPGTFKDRVFMEEDPFVILEGMLIAGYAVGARQGYLYVRGEYPRAQAILRKAIEVFRKAGYLGEDILGKGFDFDVELRSGAGAYICGEETALFESIEGRRGYPRIKPPFPTTHGLFGKPTVINNVETFANVPLILRLGVDEYRRMGSGQSAGPRLFCLSGDVFMPGLFEMTEPITLRDLIFKEASGPRLGQKIQAVLLGGAAGKFLPPDALDVRLTFEDTKAAGLSLGSGVVMVFDETRDLRQVLLSLGHFFAHESCGKCYPCQLGTQRQLEVLERLAAGRLLPGDRERLSDVGWTMTDASLCGLGQTAALAVLSAMEHWPHLFE
jgi:NADH-quinone oxidoreductase subunit F